MPTTPHSFRCADTIWVKAQERAKQEGVPMNYVIEQFINGYAHGMLDLPKVKLQYTQSKA